VLSLYPPLVSKIIMFRSYLTTALRHLWGAPGFTFINVLGLAVGMACCLLIGLYVQYELRYNTFHTNADRIAVATFESSFFGRTLSTPPAVGAVLRGSAARPNKGAPPGMKTFGMSVMLGMSP
jgi:hypothetical protein